MNRSRRKLLDTFQIDSGQIEPLSRILDGDEMGVRTSKSGEMEQASGYLKQNSTVCEEITPLIKSGL